MNLNKGVSYRNHLPHPQLPVLLSSRWCIACYLTSRALLSQFRQRILVYAINSLALRAIYTIIIGHSSKSGASTLVGSFVLT